MKDRLIDRVDEIHADFVARMIRFYQTGEMKDWMQFGEDWTVNNPDVDFANGFIEVYRDARAAKGTSQSFVSIRDAHTDSNKIASNAQYFEDRA